MNEVLKQRLVGALILLALALIFWPIVFVEPEQKSGAQSPSIPEPLVVSMTAIEAADDAGLLPSPELTGSEDAQEIADVNADADGSTGAQGTDSAVAESITQSKQAEAAPGPGQNAAQDTAVASAGTVVATDSKQPLTKGPDGAPVAWTLRVATVSSAENADALRRRLVEKGEKAYVTTISSGDKQLYRVSVGPKVERQELERIQESINAEFGVQTMLVRYVP